MLLSKELKQSILLSAIQGTLIKNDVKKASAEDYLETLSTELTQKGRLQKGIKIKTYNDEVPENWIGIKIKDLVLRDVTYGIVKLGKEDPEGVKVLRCSDVKPGYLVTDTVRTVEKDLSDQYARTILQGGEIVINVRGTLGGCAIVPKELEGYNIAREVAMIAIPECLNKEYVQNCLLSPLFWGFMQCNLRGIAYKGLNISLLKDFVLPIPPLDHQAKIVAKTKEVLAAIEEYEILENRLEKINQSITGKLKNAVLQAAFQGKLTQRSTEDEKVQDLLLRISKKRDKKIDNKENDTQYSFPEEWGLISILDATDLYTGNSIPEKEKALKYTNKEDGYNYIGTKDVNLDNTIEYENGVKIPFDEPGFRYAKPDSTLLCIEGGSAGKKIAITTQTICFGNKLCAFYPFEILPKYLFYYLQSPLFLSAFSDNISGIIGGVSINKIKQMNIPIPPIQEQERIVNRLDEILLSCDRLVR